MANESRADAGAADLPPSCAVMGIADAQLDVESEEVRA